MRVTANIPAANLTTTLTPWASDRHVLLHVFVPKTIKGRSAARQKQEEYIVDAMRLLLWQQLDPAFKVVDFKPRLSTLHQFKQTISRGAPAAKPALTNRLKGKTPPASVVAGHKQLLQKLNAITSVDELSQAIESMRADPQTPLYFSFGNPGLPGAPGLPGPPSLPDAGAWLDQLDRFLSAIPARYAPDISEVGYLFLDRTRCRQIGFEVGEHVDSLALGPGEEVVFEVRSSRKESTSSENTIEQDFESTLEQTSQDTLTQAITDTVQANQTGTASTTITPSTTVSVPTDVANVDASLNASSSNTFSNAVNDSTQNSTTLALQNSRRASSKLRQNHRLTLKSGVETGIETFSRRLLKNPNSATPITLHYFKIMQTVEMQQERAGVRLCWAPFVLDPGSRLRMQARLARATVLHQARRLVQIPPEPVPPKKKMQAVWKESLEQAIGKGSLLGDFSGMFDLRVKIADTETYTGEAQIIKSGSGADRAVIHLKTDDPHGEAPHRLPDRANADGEVVAMGMVTSDYDPLRISDTLTVKLRVEVIRQLPGYEDEELEYQRLLGEHTKEAHRLWNTAAAEARPAADAAAARILATADIRAELIASVVNQYIELMPDREASQIELWHRIIDFDHVTYTLFPGWWREGRLPLPELGAEHFLNAKLARVFLPVRPGYEEQFFDRLYHPKRAPVFSMNEYTTFVKALLKDLRKEQDKYFDGKNMPAVHSIGPSWLDYVPTNGTHVEAELGATTAADLITERQLEANAARLEADVAAVVEENRIRQLTTAAGVTNVVIGPSK